MVLVAVVPALVAAGVAWGAERDEPPDELQATASAAGLSAVSFKEPNPLPVGAGAFVTFEVPEAHGTVTGSSAVARASLLYPGPVIAGLPALMCTAGAQPFCGQPPPPFIAEAEHPRRPSATVATDGLSFREPAAPINAGVGSGSAAVKAYTSTSTARLAGYRVAAPDPARAAIVAALRQTLAAIPGARLDNDDSLLSIGGGEVRQKIEPLSGGRVRAEATAVIDDVRMLAGAVAIDSITVTSFAVTDARDVRESGSSVTTAKVTVAGFDATIGPEGISVGGRGDGGAARKELNGAARAISDAVQVATQKLRLEVRDGAATRAPDGSSAAADGLRVSLANQPLTATAPPQVPGLCGATAPLSDQLRARGIPVPPVCAVPDLTGTSDSYVFLLGRASVLLTAQLFESFDDILGGGGDVAVPDDPTFGALGPDALPPPGGSFAGDVTAPGAVGGGRRAGPRASLPARGTPSFLALESRWLGEDAGGALFSLYKALAAFAVALLVASRALLAATRTTRPNRRRP